MNVDVTFFALARELVGQEQLSVELDHSATIQDLRVHLGEIAPSLSKILSQLHMALGENYIDDSAPLFPDAQVACFPPVSGG